MNTKRKNKWRGWFLLPVGALILAFLTYAASKVGMDYDAHIKIALSLNLRDPIGMLRDHSEALWHICVRIYMKVLGLAPAAAAGAVSATAVAAAYLIACRYFQKQADGLTAGLAAVGGLILHLVGAVYVPWFNPKPYSGQGTPNIWHNPTTIMVRPFALITFLLICDEIESSRRSGFRKGPGWKKGVLTACLLILCNFAKPSFVQVFYPAVFLLMILWLIVYRGKSLKLALQLLLICLPSVAVMAAQFIVSFSSGQAASESGSSVAIMPFAVVKLYTPNVWISLLLVIAFPLVMLVIARIRGISDWTTALAWFMCLAGFMERILLAETGERFTHGNFNWGFQISLYFIWLVAMRDWLCLYIAAPRRSVRNGSRTGRNSKSRGAGFGISTALLLLHLASGIYYLYYLIVLGNPY